jgi:hypothetical protein
MEKGHKKHTKMQGRRARRLSIFGLFVSSFALCVVSSIPLAAEGQIQAFVNSEGRVVFTNMVDNPPQPPPILAGASDLLVDEVPSSLRNLVETISRNYGVDPGLVRAMIKTESNFNRWAVSNKGALGLMQLIPETGRRYGVRDFFDPEQNVDGGVHYLKFLLDKFNGNLDLSLAAYNAGENLVERLGRVPPIPETTSYVRKIRAIYKENPARVVAAPGKSVPPPKPEPPRIFRDVDSRGVVHYSNIEPPN